MLGSSASVSGPNTMLNTAVAESLKEFADDLENANNFETALHELIKRVISKHKRIIFNGNGYDDQWLREAEKRGLTHLKTTPDALPAFISEKNIRLFSEHKVYTEREMRSRYEILLGNYCKTIDIECKTMLDMAKKDILPAVSEYSQVLANTILSKKSACASLDCTYEEEMLTKVSALLNGAYSTVKALEKALTEKKTICDVTARSVFCKDCILALMNELRRAVDELEVSVSADYWPIPTYGELLFGNN